MPPFFQVGRVLRPLFAVAAQHLDQAPLIPHFAQLLLNGGRACAHILRPLPVYITHAKAGWQLRQLHVREVEPCMLRR